MDDQLLLEAASLHERFVQDMRAMDRAWGSGTLDAWLAEQLRKARQEAERGIER